MAEAFFDFSPATGLTLGRHTLGILECAAWRSIGHAGPLGKLGIAVAFVRSVLNRDQSQFDHGSAS